MALWVFGYGSLLWNPGFEPAETVKAVLHGYHRSFCMLSIHHRGTETHPGLVLALDQDANARCTGQGFRVRDGEEDTVITMLRERELVSSAYLEVNLPIHLDDGREIEAVTYVIDPDHQQYCHFPLEKQAQMIASAIGGRGPNREYLANTSAHLQTLGINDPDMEWLNARVSEL